jgi:ketosteroid isomerase-like protein
MERAPEIEQLFREAYVAIQQGNPAPMIDLFSRDESTVALGSDPDERAQGPDEVSAMLKEYAASRDVMPRVTVEDVVAHRDGDVGWGHVALAMHRPTDTVPWRETMVLRRENGDWKIIEFTVSLLVPNEAIEAAWPPEKAGAHAGSSLDR